MHIHNCYASKKTKVLRMNVLKYQEFAYDTDREFTNLLNLLISYIPRLKGYSSSKKRNVLEALEEVEYEPDQLVELEDNTPVFFYFILRGEV